ncbi:jasmonic acid-amido synthetase JAR1 [Phalaenopsis equestris]|uniref:jasmonic acid-amido synthetase JAR1 n=1 Tax=Phalaenopsis equestris TaxID=78828 RepID=UPI0009E39E17|nr:jasmonic acid-amido synthetase JAR1 [Phalaenopsis equestris]
MGNSTTGQFVTGQREREREDDRRGITGRRSLAGGKPAGTRRRGEPPPAGNEQAKTLRRILELNSRTEYLRRYLGNDFEISDHLDSSHLQSFFSSRVPLSSHRDIEPFIRRIADGEPSAGLLTGEKISMLSLSSGTTDGRQKLIPFTRFSSQATLEIFRLAAAFRSRVFPIRPKGKILEFIYSSKRYETNGGRIGTATTHWFASEEFKLRQSATQSFSCSPPEVIAAGDYRQSTYCHLLLGFLFSDEVEFVASTFAYSLVQAFSTLEQVWTDLCHDIRTGTLSSARVSSVKVRRAVLSLMARPDPDRAEKMKRICEELVNRDWAGAVRFLWPNAKYLYSIMTGSMIPYVEKLRHYAGGLPLVCADYGSTESWIGVNLAPLDPPEHTIFTVIPTFAYFEFIPLTKARYGACEEDDFEEGEAVPLDMVIVGQQYEVVLTTFTGLYRYRLGDMVEVSGFYKQTPQLKFICRRNLILTINIDKTTENDLQIVVEKALKLLQSHQAKAELVDFTSHAEAAGQPGHYVIYWEIKGSVSDQMLRDCCTEMDLGFADQGYVASRKTSSIGALELRIVGGGTFKKVMEYYIGNGAALSQFKTPRCTKNPSMLGILDFCTVKRFWSVAYC